MLRSTPERERRPGETYLAGVLANLEQTAAEDALYAAAERNRLGQ
jgi:hypothetical protein